jgi:hypothetical protein
MAQSAQDWADEKEEQARFLADSYDGRLGIMREAQLIGGAMITILLIAVVLNEVFQAVNVGSGPFSQIGTDLETTGVAAVGLLVVGLIVVAANALLGMFGSGGL